MTTLRDITRDFVNDVRNIESDFADEIKTSSKPEEIKQYILEEKIDLFMHELARRIFEV